MLKVKNYFINFYESKVFTSYGKVTSVHRKKFFKISYSIYMEGLVKIYDYAHPNSLAFLLSLVPFCKTWIFSNKNKSFLAQFLNLMYAEFPVKKSVLVVFFFFTCFFF